MINIPVIYIGDTKSPWLTRLHEIADSSNCLQVFEARQWFSLMNSRERTGRELPLFAVDAASSRPANTNNEIEQSPHVFLTHPNCAEMLPQIKDEGMAVDFLKDDQSIQVTLLENWIKNRNENQLSEARYLVASTIHDLRTPLATIMGYCSWAQELVKADQPSLKEILEKIGHSVCTMSEMIDRNLIDFEVSGGQLQVSPVPVVFEDLMSRDLRTFEVLAHKKGLQFYLDYKTPIPSVLKFDKALLIQLLGNLIDNAVKFTKSGFVRLTVSYEAKKHLLLLDVEDTGRGIQPENHDAIFSLFAREIHDDKDAVSRRGIGLGLDNAKRIAKAMGGDVVLKKSVPQEGTTFTVQIAAPIESR